MIYLPLKMGPIGFPETLITNYHHMLHNIAEEQRPYINPLNTKRRLLYLKTQFVPRSKHFSSRL